MPPRCATRASRIASLLIEDPDAIGVLARTAADVAADLVVVGSHGRTGWRERILGNVATKLPHEVQLSGHDRAGAQVDVNPSAASGRLRRVGRLVPIRLELLDVRQQRDGDGRIDHHTQHARREERRGGGRVEIAGLGRDRGHRRR